MVSYISTRGGGEPQSFEQVLLAGLAPDGGLYLPQEWPQLDFESMRGKSYSEVAFAVMKPFVGDCITDADLKTIIEDTYAGDIFDDPAVAPLMKIDDDLYLMELHRGPTLAFKDVALQLLGRLFDHVLQKRGERVTIVGATSGDTGSAAIEGCKSCENVDIFILHPKGRVSDVQRRQMTTVKAGNVYNIALEGTFDDCQNAVKAMFNDPEFRKEMNLSAVNSINWARIMAQIVYYVTTALQFDQPVSFSVPTGNFGNVFAAYCARKMGMPMGDLIVASNRNDILTRFFETGEMKITEVVPTNSPSMDIQISSNFERYLFDVLGRDAPALKNLMEDFKSKGVLSIDEACLKNANSEFKAHRLDESGTLDVIKQCYEQSGEIIDPHTAVGLYGALAYRDGIKGPLVALACAHAAKFPDAVEKATGIHPELPKRLSDLFEREEILSVLPNDLQKLQNFVREHSNVKEKSAA